MSTQELVSSWGNVIRAEHTVFRPTSRHAPFPEIAPLPSILPYGNGRSYGDSCLNTGAALLQTRALDRFIAFDTEAGTLTCEAGVLLEEVLRVAVPRGWFVPVTPGTEFVTIGGAIANDVHGKNHHGAGTFGHHLLRFELLRSDGQRRVCSPTENSEWFAATLGGLGLTGVVTWAEIQLRRISSPYMDVETIRFGNLDEFLALSRESDRDYEYIVAWVDCLSRGSSLGRGLLQRANHSTVRAEAPPPQGPRIGIPFTPPISLINAASLRLFNTAYYHRQFGTRKRSVEHYKKFFYPLDGILNWNRLYGPRGLYQYQCVLPGDGRDATAALLDTIARSGFGSFLAVLKLFGTPQSVGMLSFPQEGITLALDFPNRGEPLEHLFRQLDSIVSEAGGRLYPAKDGRMPGALFRSGYPRWQALAPFLEPRCSSNFWRRVTEGA